MNYVSVYRASQLTQASPCTIRRLIRSGKLPAHHVEGNPNPVIRESDLYLVHPAERGRRGFTGTDYGPDLLSLAEAAEAADVYESHVSWLIRDGAVQRVKAKGAKGILIHRRDVPKIIASKMQPAPGDPTPEEIRQRCAQVHVMRDELSPHRLQRRQILRLFQKHPQLSAKLAAAETGLSASICSDRLAELVTAGIIVSDDQGRGQYVRTEDSADSADVILKRFRDHSRQQVQRRHAVAA